MAKKTTPIITQAEIIVRAIKSFEAEIEELRVLCKGLPTEQADTYFDAATKEPREKLDALKILYRIETGTDFV